MALKTLPLLLAVLLLSACSANQASQFGCDFVTGSYENNKINRDSSNDNSDRGQDVAAGLLTAIINGVADVFSQEDPDQDCL